MSSKTRARTVFAVALCTALTGALLFAAGPASAASRAQNLFICGNKCIVVPLPSAVPDATSTVATTEFSLCKAIGEHGQVVQKNGLDICFTQSNPTAGSNGTSVVYLVLGNGTPQQSGVVLDSQYQTIGSCQGAVQFGSVKVGGAAMTVGTGSANDPSCAPTP